MRGYNDAVTMQRKGDRFIFRHCRKINLSPFPTAREEVVSCVNHVVVHLARFAARISRMVSAQDVKRRRQSAPASKEDSPIGCFGKRMK